MNTFDRLVADYEAWLRGQGEPIASAPDKSAEALLHEDISPEQRFWLSDYIVKWDIAERARQLRADAAELDTGMDPDLVRELHAEADRLDPPAGVPDDYDARPWESLARLNGGAKRCTCSDAQLSHVGCDCAAEQNLPVRCNFQDCINFLRSQEEIDAQMCASCIDFADGPSLEERFEHYAFEERNGMAYGSSF